MLGDGIYGDGPHFHFDYYNSYVIQPMLVDVLRAIRPYARTWESFAAETLTRARRYAAIQERLIAPDGTFPAIGRSIAYRCGAFHLLAQMALLGELATPQVRTALTAVIRKTLEAPGTFDRGWLTIGLCGHQPHLGEPYISTGSLYLCATALLPLGLPPSHPFWTRPRRTLYLPAHLDRPGPPRRPRHRLTDIGFPPSTPFAVTVTPTSGCLCMDGCLLRYLIQQHYVSRPSHPPRVWPGRGIAPRRPQAHTDAENRTSGGVGGCRGAIPVTRRDRFSRLVSADWPFFRILTQSPLISAGRYDVFMDFFRQVESLMRAVRSRLPLGGGDNIGVKSWPPAILSLFVLGMGLYTAVATALIVYRTYSPVTYWDQWEYVDVALHSQGWPSWSQLWAQFVDSRLVVDRLTGFVDLRFFGGRNVSLLMELYLVPICLALVLIRMIRRSGQLRGAALMTAAGFIAFCAFCPVQIDDFTFPVQVDFVLVDLAAVTSFAGAIWHSSKVAAGDRHWISAPLALSILAAAVAECSRASGLLVWAILVGLSFSLRFPKRTRILIAGIGLASVVIYFWGYHSPGGVLSSPWESIRSPFAIGSYVVTYFATSWDSLLRPGSVGVAASVSLTILAMVIAIVTVVRELCLRRSAPDLLRTFLAAIMFFTISVAVITSLGRLNFGAAQAAGSRYQCVALLFWAAFATLILTWATGRHARNLVLAGVQAGLLVLMVASAGRFFNSYERIAAAAGPHRPGICRGDAQPGRRGGCPRFESGGGDDACVVRLPAQS